MLTPIYNEQVTSLLNTIDDTITARLDHFKAKAERLKKTSAATSVIAYSRLTREVKSDPFLLELFNEKAHILRAAIPVRYEIDAES